MEAKKLILEKPLIVQGITLLPVSEISSYSRQSSWGIYLYCIKKPLAIVMISAHRKAAYAATGEDYPLQKLMQQLPPLERLLEQMEAA